MPKPSKQTRGVYSATDYANHVFRLDVTLNADNSISIYLSRPGDYFDGATGLAPMSAFLFRQTLKPQRNTNGIGGWHYYEGAPTMPSPIPCLNANIMTKDNGSSSQTYLAGEIDVRFTAVSNQGSLVGSQNVHVVF